MGHTIPPKRRIVQERLRDLMRMARALREPYRSRFTELVQDAAQHIAPVVYANSLDDEEMIIFAMLARRAPDMENRDAILRCLSILLREGSS